MGAEANKAAAQAAYDGFNAGDLGPLLAIVAPDVVWTSYEDNPFNGTHHGPDGVLQAMSNVELIDITRFEVTNLFAEGDRVVGIVEVAYTVKSTGKSFAGPVAHIMDFVEGKLAVFREVSATSADAWS